MQKLTKIVAVAAIIGTVTGTSLCFAQRATRRAVKNGGVETTEEANMKKAYAKGYELGYKDTPPSSGAMWGQRIFRQRFGQ